jgi:hypothetical protein
MLSQSHIRGLLGSWETATEYTVPATLLDVSGNGNNGTNVATTWTSGRFGTTASAIIITNNSQYIETTYQSWMQFRSGFSIECSFYCDSSSVAGRILSNSTSLTGATGYQLYVATANTIFFGINGASASVSVDILNKWTHLVVVVNNLGEVTFYVNGVQTGTANQPTAALTNITSTTPIRIGNVPATNTRYFPGKIESLHIVGTTRNSSEIAQLYNDWLAGMYPSIISNMLLSYIFDAANATPSSTLIDKSGNGNNATIVGGTWTADRFGRANRAILLDGVDDYIDLGLASYQGDYTVVISSYILTSSARNIFSRRDDTNNYSRLEVNYSGSPNTAAWRCAIAGSLSGSQITAATSPFNFQNNWNMLGVSFKANTRISVFANRTRESTNNKANTLTAPYEIGRFGTTYANMIVDRIMFFDRELSAFEMCKLANRLKIGDMNK